MMKLGNKEHYCCKIFIFASQFALIYNDYMIDSKLRYWNGLYLEMHN